MNLPCGPSNVFWVSGHIVHHVSDITRALSAVGTTELGNHRLEVIVSEPRSHSSQIGGSRLFAESVSTREIGIKILMNVEGWSRG